MKSIKIDITNNTKYYCYHVIVFLMFIITCIQLYFNADNFTIFGLFVVLIQLFLFCCINTNNHYLEIPNCCYILIGFTNLSMIIFIIYLAFNIDNFQYVKNNLIKSIYLICLCFYIPTVLFLINWYYLSSEKYSKIYCILSKPNTVGISVNLPTIHIPLKNIKYRNIECCTICVEPFNSNNKKTKLICNHEMCNICVQKIESINNKCPYCKIDMN